MKVTSGAASDKDMTLAEALELEQHTKTNGQAHNKAGGDVAENSEIWLAEKFSDQHGDTLRHVSQWGRWLIWRDGQWHIDETMEVWDKARGVVARASAALNTADKKTMAKGIANSKTVAGVVRLAGTDRRHAATVDQWDVDPWLLNTPAGVVDLRTGEIREHDPVLYCSKMTAAAPADHVPDDCDWMRFLGRITGWNNDLVGFLQRAVGYSLTGSTKEEAFFFLYGRGQNGKSKFLTAVSGACGSYHEYAAMTTFIASKHEPIPTDLAKLQGARLVTAVETESGRRWAESKIKAITGGDPISARFMRQDFFTYWPKFKLWVAGNHKPGLRSVDKAIRRRLHLVPFKETIPDKERDRDLSLKLQAEWPYVLRWAIDGCLQWQESGVLAPPPIVEDATKEYLESEDLGQQWLDECCDVHPGLQDNFSALWRSWETWAGPAQAGNKKRFGQMLQEKEFTPEHTRNGRIYKGLVAKGASQ